MSNQEDTDDKTLIIRFQQKKDPGAYDELVRRYSGKVYRVAYGILNDREDAEEVTQDAFVRAYKALPSFRGDSSFYTWIYRIAINLARNRISWNKVRGEGKVMSLDAPLQSPGIKSDSDLTLEIPDGQQTPAEHLSLQELKHLTDQAMKQLPEIYRTALSLRNAEGLGHEEIARILNCKTGTVKSRIARGREELRKLLAPWLHLD